MVRPTLVVTILSIGLASPASAGPVSAAQSRQIVAKIIKKMKAFYGKYRGVKSRRKATVKEYDSKSMKLLSTKEIVQEGTIRFGKTPLLKILGCKVDGRPAALDKCKMKRKKKRKPRYQVFGKDHAKHYSARVVGRARVKGKRCYAVQITPRKKSQRHFTGKMYFTEADLSLVKIEGRSADLPFPIKSFYMNMYFKKKGDVDVGSYGYVDVWIHVPLITRKRIVSRFSAYNHVLLRR